MSMHKQPLTELERSGLEKYHLPIGTPSQLSDCFRLGIAYARAAVEAARVPDGWLDLLRSIEWGAGGYNRFGDSENMCPCCENWQSDGHASNCRVAAMLSSAPPVAQCQTPRACEFHGCQGKCKAQPAERKPLDTELVDYILQDDIHNRLTPRVADIAYSAFVIGRSGKNKDDGGPCDWFNDTKPMVTEQIAKIRKELNLPPTE